MPATRSGSGATQVRTGRATRDRGAAAVEFALVVPLLLVLVFGIVEFSRAYGTQAALSQASRAGARTLATGGTATAARTAVQQAALGLDLTAAEITVSPSTCVGATSAAEARVAVTRRQAFLTGLFGSAITLSSTAVMRCVG